MTIEFTNATPAKQNSALSNILLGVSFVFLFAPITLVVIGYYSSLPTGTLVSPIPQGVLSVSPTPQTTNNTVIANQLTENSSTSATTNTNATDKTIVFPPQVSEVTINDISILESSQIYFIPREGDKSLYTLKNKSAGQITVSSTSTSDTERVIDYQIVNP